MGEERREEEMSAAPEEEEATGGNIGDFFSLKRKIVGNHVVFFLLIKGMSQCGEAVAIDPLLRWTAAAAAASTGADREEEEEESAAEDTSRERETLQIRRR